MLMREHDAGGTETVCPILATAWRGDGAHCLGVNCMWWMRDPACDHAGHDAADDDSGCALAVLAYSSKSVSYNVYRMAGRGRF